MINIFKRYRIEIALLFIGLISINIFLFSEAFQGNHINAENAASYGTLVSGYIGTFFTLISIILLVRSIRDQSATAFKTTFFELIKFHRENVQHLEIENYRGVSAFGYLLDDLRTVLKIVKDVAIARGIDLADHDTRRDWINLAYITFFFGDSSNIGRKSSLEINLVTEEILKEISTAIQQHRMKPGVGYGPPFCPGCQSAVAHYFRHLYYTVLYLDKGPLPVDEKMNLAGILRNQLTNEEQALLFYNTISSVGRKWEELKLVEKYQLIKNLPHGFIDPDTEIDVTKVYKMRWQYEE